MSLRGVRLAVGMMTLTMGLGVASHPQAPDGFRDTSMLKPPAGSRVAIVVFEDLGCPGCARAHPLEAAAAERNHVPLVRYDFPIPAHIWTFDGAVCARYLQDRVNPRLADEYRTAVFQAQAQIGSKEDLQQFTQQWFNRHGQVVPFVMDPDGRLAREVKADFDLGMRMNLYATPTLVVVTRDHGYQVVCGVRGGNTDPAKLEAVVEQAVAQSHAGATAVRH